MKLCSNRPEGFGPHSTLHPALPTTCFQDIVVIPLAAWIYLLLFIFVPLPLLFLGRMHHGQIYPDSKNDIREERSVLRTIFRVLYYFLILALVAMLSLEIARLVDAELGIGLLPFLYPTFILAAGFRTILDFKWIETSRVFALSMKAVNTLLWLMLTTVFAIKVGAYSLEGLGSRDGREPGERYKVVDEVTDDGVIVGLAVVLGAMEVFC